MAHVIQKSTQYGLLVGALEGNSLLGSLRHEREDNIKMGLKVIGLASCMFFVPCIVIQLCNVDQQNAYSLIRKNKII